MLSGAISKQIAEYGRPRGFVDALPGALIDVVSHRGPWLDKADCGDGRTWRSDHLFRRVLGEASARRVVATSGGFDPIHPGHISSLQESRTYGDVVVVIVNGDSFLTAKKGKPFQDLQTRCLIVSAINGVDYVVPFEIEHDTTVGEALRRLKPDAFAKGGDRIDHTSIPEWDVCQELGIEVVSGVGDDKRWSSSWFLDEDWSNHIADGRQGTLRADGVRDRSAAEQSGRVPTTGQRTWPASWETEWRGDECHKCEQGRPTEDTWGVRWYADDFADAYLLKKPAHRGYSVVVFRGRHVPDPACFTAEESVGYWNAVRKVGATLHRVYSPAQINYQCMNNSVPHVHTHVLPRFLGSEAIE